MRFTRRALAISAFLTTVLASVAAAQENLWTSHGPAGIGWVNDVAIGAAAYAATPDGVFRSTDGGDSWQQAGLAGTQVIRIAARPEASVVLALTVRGDTTLLFLSRDEGGTWSEVSGLASVAAADIDPWNPTNLYAATNGDQTVWRSTDGGAHWTPGSTVPRAGGWQRFAFDGRAIYATSYDTGTSVYGLFRSADGGANWEALSLPIPYVTAIAGGGTPGVVYAAGSQLCRSADSAATWTCSILPASTIGVVGLARGPNADTRILALGLRDLFVSDDGGSSWTAAVLDLQSVGYTNALASDAAGSVALLGTSTGIFRSRDRGASWTASRAGLRSADIASLAIAPGDGSTLFADTGFYGTSSPHLFRSADSGSSWSPAGNVGGPLVPNGLVVDPRDPERLYAAASQGVYRSDDGGASWTVSSTPKPGVSTIAADPTTPQSVWIGTNVNGLGGGGLFRSDDGARTWTAVAEMTQAVYSLVFDVRKPGTIYSGSYFDIEPGSYGYPEGGSIFMSANSGATFEKIGHDFANPIISIVPDPFDPSVLYAAAYTSFARSTDGGRTWTDLAADIGNLSSMVADPVRPDRLYVATDRGVYRSIDGAQTWQPFSAGLGPLQAKTLVISPDGKWLHAGTNGGGVFDLNLEDSLTCSPTQTRLCLLGNRYAVELLAARVGETPSNPGMARPLNDRSGFFALPFATGDPELPEVVVKMLPDRTYGVQGAPFFYSSLTTLPFVLTVTDTLTGWTEVHASNPDAPLCGGADLFAPGSPWDYSMRLLSAPTAADETKLALLGGRFSVTLEARHPVSGRIASGVTMQSGDRFGIFSLPDFTGDPQFPEVVVKMIDFSAVNGSFWFFYAGLTSLDYTLTVSDSVTGAVRTYRRPAPYCGGADVRAFTN